MTTTAPRVLVLRAPGINCERETLHAYELAGGAPEFVHVHKLLADPSQLDRFSILAVPGGFAYGDDIAAGRVLANAMRFRLGDALRQFVDRGGLVLGICNGFQVLVRVGLLPREDGGALSQAVSLTHNLSNHYECRWVTLEAPPNRCVFVDDGMTMRCPAAHGEGYLQAADRGAAESMIESGLVSFRYVDAAGTPTETYPANPNGSPLALAGLTDHSGRVLGLMPHPDRAYLAHHMPNWRRDGLSEHGDGLALFANMVRAARAEA